MSPLPEEGLPHVLDLRDQVCPMTYVRTKLALEALAPGDRLEVWLAGQEPARNVPRSARQEGHHVLSVEPGPEGTTRVLIEKR